MADDLISVSDALDAADGALLSGARAAPFVLPTGFPLLDTYLGGGLRGGELCLLGGGQGLGKTTLALQAARHAATMDEAGLVLSYEHDATTLLERLITLEAGELLGIEGLPMRRVRDALEGGGAVGATLEERLSIAPGGVEAIAALRAYGHRLLLHPATGRTGMTEIRELLAAAMERSQRRPLLVVDYLQKIGDGRPHGDEERIRAASAGLKELALDLGVPVLAVVAADKEGLTPGRRLRVNHLQGAEALAYEADVVLIMNEKYDVVARRHLMYDTRASGTYRDYVVITIEKNRSGLSRIDLQVRKRLEQSRFERDIQAVPEELTDERLDNT